MDRLSMSLDDIMAMKTKEQKKKFIKTKTLSRDNHVGGIRNNKQHKVRSNPYASEENDSNSRNNFKKQSFGHQIKLIQPFNNKNDHFVIHKSNDDIDNIIPKVQVTSVFSRLGQAPKSGTRVTFTNLQNSVEEADLKELCNSIGEIKDLELNTKSKKRTAVVLFARRSDAMNCINKFNGLTLDGSIMNVVLTEETDMINQPANIDVPKSVFDRINHRRVDNNNVKKGFFGTAMEENDDDDDDDEEERDIINDDEEDEDDEEDNEDEQSTPIFSVTMNSNSNKSSRLIQPFKKNYNKVEQSNTIIKRKFSSNNKNKIHNSNKNHTVTTQFKQNKRKPMSANDLDDDLTAYFAAK